MSRRVRVREVLEYLEIADGGEVLTSLRREGLFEAEEVDPAEAEDLRVAAVLMRDLGVNAAGVQVILRMRRRLLALEQRAEEALREAVAQGRPPGRG